MEAVRETESERENQMEKERDAGGGKKRENNDNRDAGRKAMREMSRSLGWQRQRAGGTEEAMRYSGVGSSTRKDPGEGAPPVTSQQHLLPPPQAQLSEQELHYASLLSVPCREGPGLSQREGSKEDPSSDYACIAKN